MPVAEIDEIFRQYQDQWRFLDPNWGGILRSIFTLNPKYFHGLYQGNRLTALIASHLRHVHDFTDFNRPGLPPEARPFLLAAVNLADGQETIFAPPGVPPRGEFRICTRQSVAFAVHCSITIPGTFVPVACEPRPGCPCYGKGTQYYVDGGVRDMYPITAPVRLLGATHVIGVNLGYAGMREDIWRNGPADYFNHIIEIMGHDQEEADYQDREVSQAQVVTVNPLIYDVGGFEAKYIPQLIARGEAVTEECLRGQGLRPEIGRRANLARLFPPGRPLLRYPAKGTPAFDYWLANSVKGKQPTVTAGKTATGHR
jgi:predicted acylesterase/phospholipase RssA